MVFKNKEQVNKKMKNLIKSSFSEPKNLKVKPLKSFKPRERYQAEIDLIRTMYKVDLNIFLQWLIISKVWMGNPIK